MNCVIELEVGDNTWAWENGSLVVEATDPSMTGGVIHAVLTVRSDGAIVERSRLNLTSDRERSRFMGLVGAKGETIDDRVILAIEEAIRETGLPGGEPNRAGSGIALEDPEPWPEPVDGADLLEDLVGAFERFLALLAGGSETMALWTLNAHAHDASEISALLALTSPEKRCGKTTGLHLLSALVPRPLPAANITSAALFRAVEPFRPTLLVDEMDTFIRDRDELRGILNSGHARASAIVICTVGDEHDVRIFSTWSPKALAMIGELPDTLRDRSILLPMRRRAPGETIERLRLDRLHELEPLRRMACRWARDHIDALRGSDPESPDLHDRAADNWRPLLAIADRAGGEWPDRARKAARIIAGLEAEDDGSVRTLLLQDLHDLFNERRATRLSSQEVVDALAEREDRPWGEWGRSRKPMTTHGLAKLLRPFRVSPKKLRFGDNRSLQGYGLEDLQASFGRYLPSLGGVRNWNTRNNGLVTRKTRNRATGTKGWMFHLPNRRKTLVP